MTHQIEIDESRTHQIRAYAPIGSSHISHKLKFISFSGEAPCSLSHRRTADPRCAAAQVSHNESALSTPTCLISSHWLTVRVERQVTRHAIPQRARRTAPDTVCLRSTQSQSQIVVPAAGSPCTPWLILSISLHKCSSSWSALKPPIKRQRAPRNQETEQSRQIRELNSSWSICAPSAPTRMSRYF